MRASTTSFTFTFRSKSSPQQLPAIIFLLFQLPVLTSGYSILPLFSQTRPITIALAAAPENRRVSYDLGLGKNKPVSHVKKCSIPSSSLDQQDYSSTQSAVQYLVEHDGSMDYPSPLAATVQAKTTDSEAAVVTITNTPQRRRTSRSIIPSRFSNDIISIQRQPSYDHPVAFAVAAREKGEKNSAAVEQGRRRRQWDLNTPWVEMLIHEQQRTLAVEGQN